MPPSSLPLPRCARQPDAAPVRQLPRLPLCHRVFLTAPQRERLRKRFGRSVNASADWAGRKVEHYSTSASRANSRSYQSRSSSFCINLLNLFLGCPAGDARAIENTFRRLGSRVRVRIFLQGSEEAGFEGSTGFVVIPEFRNIGRDKRLTVVPAPSIVIKACRRAISLSTSFSICLDLR